jgi:hypothetical protein
LKKLPFTVTIFFPITCMMLCLAPLALAAQTVAEDELRIEEKVEFINFEGRQREYPADVIREIGRVLSRGLDAGNIRAWYANKYSVIHAYDPKEPQRLGADIIIFEKNAGVNHINSVRLILTGFLEKHYGYERKDAELLSVFATYYNAVYRGNIPYFGGKYQSVVLNNMNETNAGLARHYKDWPGKTRLLIPLTAKAAEKDIRSLDTSELTEKKVVEELQKKEDRGIADRKKMTELKERQVEESEKELEEEKTDLEKKKSDLEKTESDLEKQREEIERRKKELEKEKKEAQKIADEEKKREREKEIAQKEKEIAAEKEKQAESEKELEEKKKEIQEKEKGITEEEKEVVEKREEIEKDRETIKRDEKIAKIKEDIKKDADKVAEELLKKEEELKQVARREPIAAGILYYLKVKRYLTDGHYANDLYRIDAATGDFISKAPEKPHIAGHKYEVIPGEGVLVLTHGEGLEAHHLTLLDLVTLEPIVVGDTNIFHMSFIEKRGDSIYAVNFKSENDFRLGRYDAKTLKLVVESEERIDKNTVFHMFGDSVFVNSKDKLMLILDSKDLIKKNVIDLP